MKKEIFKAYDIRGIYPEELNENDVYKIAKAYATWLKPQRVALGRDVRLSGEKLFNAALRGLTETGVDVVDIGVVSTDMLYFSVANYGYDGGITISASHNAGEYNGMKLVRENSRPISIDTGIAEIRDLALTDNFAPPEKVGNVEKKIILEDYLEKNLSFIDERNIKPLRAVANANFGASGVAISEVANRLGLELIKLNFEPNGEFPKGKPDPLQKQNREETEAQIRESKVDFGVTWDADADRCFFYDEKGDFIHPYYITALQMEYFISKNGKSKFLVDPRFVWLAQDIAADNDCELIINKSGHSFIKERMRKEDVLFAAESSAHYYYKDIWFTDNGLVPLMIIMEILSNTDKSFSELINIYKKQYYAVPETNFEVESVPQVIDALKEKYPSNLTNLIDGYSAEFGEWRFNIRGSNTEPVIRLCIEAKTQAVAEGKLKELSEVINGS
jgi:phosphomannomutase